MFVHSLFTKCMAYVCSSSPPRSFQLIHPAFSSPAKKTSFRPLMLLTMTIRVFGQPSPQTLPSIKVEIYLSLPSHHSFIPRPFPAPPAEIKITPPLSTTVDTSSDDVLFEDQSSVPVEDQSLFPADASTLYIDPASPEEQSLFPDDASTLYMASNPPEDQALEAKALEDRKYMASNGYTCHVPTYLYCCPADKPCTPYDYLAEICKTSATLFCCKHEPASTPQFQCDKSVDLPSTWKEPGASGPMDPLIDIWNGLWGALRYGEGLIGSDSW